MKQAKVTIQKGVKLRNNTCSDKVEVKGGRIYREVLVFFLEQNFLENFFGIFLGGGNIHTRPTITNNWVPGRLQLQMGISCFDTMRRKKKTC